MSKPKYKRVLLKLSGEALGHPETGQGLHFQSIESLAKQVAKGVNLGIQIGIVIGGGNLWRGGRKSGLALERTASDTIGMLGTVMNTIAFGQVLQQLNTPARILSAIGPSPQVERYEIAKARQALSEGEVVLIGGGTSNPYFTTDSAAALRALELKAEILLKATTVDGVYSADPNKDSSAQLYSELSFAEAIEKRLRIMDTSAFSLCAEGNIPIFVFNSERPQGLCQALLGQGQGTRVYQEAIESC